MPRFIPTPAQVVIPDFLDGAEDRGSFFLDLSTRSTLGKVSAYTKLDNCDEPTYRVGSQAMTINGNDDNCQNGLVASASVKVTVPLGATAAQIQSLVNYLGTNISAAMIAP